MIESMIDPEKNIADQPVAGFPTWRIDEQCLSNGWAPVFPLGTNLVLIKWVAWGAECSEESTEATITTWGLTETWALTETLVLIEVSLRCVQNFICKEWIIILKTSVGYEVGQACDQILWSPKGLSVHLIS